MLKKLAILGALAIATVAIASIAFAGKPTDPGCFGKDRAAYNKNVAQADLDATFSPSPGASETGQHLSGRAGDNGAINRDYKTTCGGDAS